MILADFPWQIFMSPFGIPIAGVIGAFTWLTIASVSEAVTKVMCNRNNSELKLELLARGFSAQEIIGVIEAGANQVETTPPIVPAPAERSPSAAPSC